MNMFSKSLLVAALSLPLIVGCSKKEEPVAAAPTAAESAAKDAAVAVQAAGDATKEDAAKTGEAAVEAAK